MTDSDPTLRERLEETFWARHANPWSAGTRFLALPALMTAVYRRDRRLLLATLAFTLVNPVVFPAPERTDSYLSRIVLAEREWLSEGNGTMGTDYPNVLNLCNAVATLYALVSAVRRDRFGTVLGTLCAMEFKLRWVDAVVRETGVTGEGPTGPAASSAESSAE
ncbi:hypothetical protein C474_20641 [Halogeometricum pallidum JCM 14848]|uniref:Uncharacterized protein n=1 Tax=Halogeometricum pallidum JCM 14848 TaxID=1227487 RepID=M0CUR3_HALPD|nr:DUF6653 family protein [Halogeometricum pallidum]ELZ26147.1 hypothetical protein C474_20641 [Halogeometricum pallidum JCM 14848]